MKNFKGNRTFGEKTMHKTTCNKCGDTCEVPFMPNGKKPVFCANCFVKDDSGSSRTFDHRNDHHDKVAYPATCGDCGARCTVPFKPMQGKPVKCRECFVTGDRRIDTGAGIGISHEQFQILNTKLDTILKALGTYVSTPKRLKEPETDFSLEVDTTPTEKPKKKAWSKLKYKK